MGIFPLGQVSVAHKNVIDRTRIVNDKNRNVILKISFCILNAIIYKVMHILSHDVITIS